MPTNKLNFLFFFVVLFASCQPKEKFDWEIGLSAPKYYSSIPSVQFFYKDKIVHSVSSDFGIDPGWGQTAGGYASGKDPDNVPDSLVLNWDCGVDMISYELKTILPREKMLKLFQNPVTDVYGETRPYSLIIVGTAPSGNVTVWMRAVNVLTEIAKFKAKEIKKNDPYDKDRVTLWTSTGKAAKENFIYLNLHGIPYKVWEEGEKEYDYDIGFTSENNTSKISILTFYTKSGEIFQPGTYSEAPITIDQSSWDISNFISNNNRIKKKPLPIMVRIELMDLNNPDDYTNYYITDVILPLDFEKLYCKKYFDSVTNNYEKYNRIIIGVSSDIEKGFISLEGKNKRSKVMDFKIHHSIVKENGDYSNEYSLPKGFKFPKWEGREKLSTPDIEFWQEQ